jgi:Xaa-Pro aminopeptidase
VPFFGCSNSVWKRGSLLTHDASFCYEGYLTDKTQTYFAGNLKGIPAKVKKAHEACLAIEASVAGRMRAGAIASELYALALEMADKAGFADGFMGIGNSKAPFLGHGIGLYMDEWPVLAKRFDMPLQAGMTLAVEPKIGLPGVGMVGVENTWEITESSAVCLSSSRRGEIICVE